MTCDRRIDLIGTVHERRLLRGILWRPSVSASDFDASTLLTASYSTPSSQKNYRPPIILNQNTAGYPLRIPGAMCLRLGGKKIFCPFCHTGTLSQSVRSESAASSFEHAQLLVFHYPLHRLDPTFAPVQKVCRNEHLGERGVRPM